MTIKYRVEDLGAAHTPDRLEGLNVKLAALGEDDWRLVGVSGTIGYFVREETEEEKPDEEADHEAPHDARPRRRGASGRYESK
jgi:hypothetical protein